MPALAAAAAGLFALALFWPGFAEYDTVTQYRQVLTGRWDDWHPPAMVALWRVLTPLGPGAAPMFVVQIALYSAGLGLWAGALARGGRAGAAWLVAPLGFLPLTLGWQGVVLKDSQMLGALLAASGLVAWFRLTGRRVPAWAAAAAILLAGYATLVRGNALFATVPLVVLALPVRRWWARAALVAGGVLAIAALTPTINQRMFGAQSTGVATSLPVYGLAAIAVGTGPDQPSPFTPGERAAIVGRHCVKAFFWDPLGDPTRCGTVIARVQQAPGATLYRDFVREVARHPLVFAAQRIGHWNMTERWWVPAGLILAAPPEDNEPNDLRLARPGAAARWWQREPAALEAATPLGWPIGWTIVAALIVAAMARSETAAGRAALALAGSALMLEASFLLVSISSDLRYHLWPMTASALALLLAWPETGKRWRLAGAALLVAVAAAGIVARSSLPRAPATYRAMVDAPSG